MAKLGVTLETTFDARRMSAAVSDDLDSAMVQLAAHVEQDTRARWVGWENATGRSRRAWEAIAEVAPGATRGDVLLANDAKDDRGRPYVQYVHRAGDRTREIERVRARLRIIADDRADEMGEQFARTLNTPGPAQDRS